MIEFGVVCIDTDSPRESATRVTIHAIGPSVPRERELLRLENGRYCRVFRVEYEIGQLAEGVTAFLPLVYAELISDKEAGEMGILR